MLVRQIPQHLRGDRQLADYFEECGWAVESVAICREVEPVRRELERRTNALVRLEEAWVEWVGNPAGVGKGEGYEVGRYAKGHRGDGVQGEGGGAGGVREGVLIPDLNGDADEGQSANSGDPSRSGTLSSTNSNSDTETLLGPSISRLNGDGIEAGHNCGPHIHTTRPRPTYRPRLFGNQVDAIEYWEKEFDSADMEVRRLRKEGAFGATACGFVTFEDFKSAVSPHHNSARHARKVGSDGLEREAKKCG